MEDSDECHEPHCLPHHRRKNRFVSSWLFPNSTQRTPKKRISTMSVPDTEANREYEENNVTSTALATVASLRRSSGSSGKKNRQPLSRESCEPRRASSGRVSSTSTSVRQRMTSTPHPRCPRSQPHPKSHRGSGIAHLSAILLQSIVDDNEDDDPLSSGSDHASRQAAQRDYRKSDQCTTYRRELASSRSERQE